MYFHIFQHYLQAKMDIKTNFLSSVKWLIKSLMALTLLLTWNEEAAHFVIRKAQMQQIQY